MAKRQRAEEQNLDPLLDTMSNVVGILVMLVAVTQLTVGDAVDRIRESGERVVVSEEEVSAAAARQDDVESAVVAAEGRLEAFRPSEARDGLLLEAAREHIEAMEALEGRHRALGVDPETLGERIDERAAALAAARATADQQRRRLAALDQATQDEPTTGVPKIARLPDPRPPPPGATPVIFICRYGRVVYFDMKAAVAEMRAGISNALGDDRGLTPADSPWLKNFFAKQRIGAGNFYWSIRDSSSGTPFAEIAWIDELAGETGYEIRTGDSRFLEVIRQYDPGKHYLRFFVFSDSQDTYLEARYRAEALGWDVGWDPADEEHYVGIDLAGRSGRTFQID